LARQVLGGALDEERLGWIVARADGNAFHLEELIHASAGGHGGPPETPDTVLAMVEARLAALPPEARRALRAASVFGTTFWQGGVAALLDDPGALAWLAPLAEEELISPPRDGRFPGELEHGFQNAAVRDAAYATLADADREIAHRLAGEWLAARGAPP
jgi:predicted ATPase